MIGRGHPQGTPPASDRPFDGADTARLVLEPSANAAPHIAPTGLAAFSSTLTTPSLTAPAGRSETRGVNDLNWDFKQLERAALREGSRNTRRDRSYALRRIGTFLHANFRGLRARNLKEKHVEAVVAGWFERDLAPGTMANLRWAADKLGKGDIVKANAFYGIARGPAVDNVDRSRPLDLEKLALVRDMHVRMSLRLQVGFG